MKRTGFTLIELLVVISIIGILVGLSIFGLQGARQSSRDAKRKADLELIRSGIEIYKSDCNRYYIGASLPSPLVGNPALSSSCLASNVYISQVPTDSVSTQNYSYKSVDGINYHLCAALEQAPSPLPGGLSSCASCGSSVSCNYIVTNP